MLPFSHCHPANCQALIIHDKKLLKTCKHDKNSNEQHMLKLLWKIAVHDNLKSRHNIKMAAYPSKKD